MDEGMKGLSGRENNTMQKNEQAVETKKNEELQKIIAAVDEVMENTALLDNIRSEKELEEVLPALLASLGKYAKADRSYIFELKPGRTDVLHMTHIWCAENAIPTFEKAQYLPLSRVPNWISILNKEGVIAIYDWEAEKEKWPEEYRLFSAYGINSIIVLPLITGGTVTGYIGIDNPKQNRAALTVSLLKGISGHISGLKENLHMMKKLEEKQISLQESLKELNQEKNILDALSVDYTSIYYCDLLNDSFIPIKCEDYNNAAGTIKKIAEKGGSYSDCIRYYFEHFVIRESAPDFLEKMDAKHLMEHLGQNERFACKYRVHPNRAGQQYFEVQIVRLPQETGFKVIMGYRYIDDLVVGQEKLQTKLENALAEATLNGEIIGSISKIYWLIYRIDLEKKTYEEISATQETHKLTGRKGYIADILQELYDKIVADEYWPMMREFWNISTLPERLKNADSVAIEYKTRDGSWNLSRIIAQNRDKDGNVRNALYLVQKVDLEKKKEIEYKQQLMENAEDARRANMAKTDFLQRMSHDIRTPLNGIIGLLRIDEDHFDDIDLVKENHEKMKVAAGHLLSLINDVLQMSKLEEGNIVLSHEWISLMSLTRDIVNIIIERATEAGIKWNYERGKTEIPYPYIYGSPLHLRQIFLNVYGNCIKYNRPGGKITTVVEALEEHDGIGTYRWTITDTGVGMSREFLRHIFEPFAQEKNDARSVYQGTGLGMAIVKKLIDQMNGSIEVSSKLGVGSRFVITIPFEIAPPPEELPAKPAARNADIFGLKLLLAEDNELNADIAKTLLTDAGAGVIVVKNGKEALEAFESNIPGLFDAILMDVMMPVMDGLEATRAIRALPRKDAKEIPIIAMTANAFEEDARRCLAAGMNAHFAKPYQIEQLAETIASCCRRGPGK